MHSKGLPKALREALEYLASENLIKQLAIATHEQVLLCADNGENVSAPELDFDIEPSMEWAEGVEEFKDSTIESLWSMLGLFNNELPFFNITQDPNGVHDPWVKADQGWLANSNNTIPLMPHWHQLVGIVKMVEQAFKGEPILLMDEVGIGKTMQVIGVVAVLTFFREFHSKYNRFPGAFGEWYTSVLDRH